uniref:DUF4537 domain-containing protein n=1 Tax=Labrus bergylta TaxID=56723 RepID=A0A3Q3E952_9LABR
VLPSVTRPVTPSTCSAQELCPPWTQVLSFFLTSPRCSLGNPLQPCSSFLQPGLTLSGQQFYPGCRVLARREMDGLYYLGALIHPGLGFVPSQRQLACSLDMVTHTRALTSCLVPGDPVLSPWEPDLIRHGPGRLMAATERRDVLGGLG